MEEQEKTYGKLRRRWLAYTLKQKIGIFVWGTTVIVLLSLMIDLLLLNFALHGFNSILGENLRVSRFQEAMEAETKGFENYIRNRTQGSEENFKTACRNTEDAIRMLPYDYHQIGARRYARTWNIRNSYEAYAKIRDAFIKMRMEDQGYVKKLYLIYQMQDFEKEYGRNLAQMTLEEGNAAYEQRVPLLHRLPMLLCAAGLCMLFFLFYLSRGMSHYLGQPVLLLVEEARKIARNDFTGEDLTVENRDEMGELVRAFNKMKHATLGYINTLEEKHEALELLHQEELEKLEVEKRLETTKLELLKSQLNPHFLFNTLNMIACMAKLEDAKTTERMTSCMSNLFRYTLKNPDPNVQLSRELKVVKDYMYIQQMRFGERIRCEIDCSVDENTVMIPTFTLQPIVENAVIHGLAGKEEGGCIYIKIWQKNRKLILSVADTGSGISQDKLKKLREDLETKSTASVGIGLGNIYRRIHAVYREGEFEVHSREGRGTVVRMAWEMEEKQDV